MQVGIHNVRFDFPGGSASVGPTVAATARTADQVGVASFTFMDHWFQMDQMAPATDPMLEGYTALGFVAAHTESMRLGLLVAEMAGYARLGVATVDLMPTGDPIAYVERVGAEIIPRLADLDPG